MKKLTCLLLLFTWAYVACQTKTEPGHGQVATTETDSAPYQDLSVADFKAKMNGPDVILLDVRTPAEIAEGKIEGALELDIQSPDFAQKIDELNKEKTYLVYCRSGGRSSKACTMMADKGFKKLYNLDGGFTAWSSEN